MRAQAVLQDIAVHALPACTMTLCDCFHGPLADVEYCTLLYVLQIRRSRDHCVQPKSPHNQKRTKTCVRHRSGRNSRKVGRRQGLQPTREASSPAHRQASIRPCHRCVSRRMWHPTCQVFLAMSTRDNVLLAQFSLPSFSNF